jgi:hypothetical protein
MEGERHVSGLEPVCRVCSVETCDIFAECKGRWAKMESDKEFELRLKKDNAIRKRYYVMAKLRKSDTKKLRKWLDRKAEVDVATENNGHVVLVNVSGIENCRTPNLFH